MMKSTGKKWISILLILCMALAIMPAFTKTAQADSESSSLIVAYAPFSGRFSPFYANTAYDQDVVRMTQLSLLTTDRRGAVIFNAIQGETVNYNGTDYTYTGPANVSVQYNATTDTTKYTMKLRKDLKFSDGVPVTADDIIFTYYTYLDPAYVGSGSLSSYDIVGLQNYRTQTSDEVYAKYAEMVRAIFAAGDQGYVQNAQFTREYYNAYWAMMKQEWINDIRAIVAYVLDNYGTDDYVQSYFSPDFTAAQIWANEGLQIAYGMALWGFGQFQEDGTFANGIGTWDLATTFPTIEDFYDICYARYDGDPDAYWAVECADDTDVHGTVDDRFIREYGSKDELMGGQGVKYIEGIKKVDNYTVSVTLNGFSTSAVYSILGIQITPMHYYGDTAKYNYEEGKFGFDFGDLSKVQSLTEVPMGAGPYVFESYEDGVVTFRANPYWYKGEPKIKTIRFKELSSAEFAAALSAGDADVGELTGSRTRFEEIASYNSNGEITGDVITTSKVDNLVYAYIGMNADNVNIGGTPDSAESKALRKALATILAVYRGVAYDSYYGEAASVIQYPISNSSWAAPQPSDPGYRIAFSVDANGNDIYTADMSAEQKYEAAKAAALTWFEAAGYTVEDGKVTAAPEGGKVEFEVIIPGDGQGDHPSYTVLTMAKEALESIGISLIINDPADSNELWNALDAGTQELWCAAWRSTIDPDMYQVYHGNNIVGKGGTDSNHYHIDDATLNELIMEARTSDDQAFRKATYKQCLDIIVDWAVEIPAYQRQNCIIFSTKRINISTLTPDITTYWDWMNDIEKLEMDPSFESVPIITQQPKSQTVAKGKKVTFKVEATRATTYQWYYSKNNGTSWVKWNGQTNPTLKVTGSETNNGCIYRCLVMNNRDSVYSSWARLTVSDVKPMILTHPKARTVAVGKSVTFKVVAGGAGKTYQWYYSKNNGASWTSWSGKTSNTLTVTGSATNNGCLYRCVVKNNYGSVTSNAARLTVSGVKPRILTQPKAKTAAVEKNVTFSVVAAGTELSYQWYYSRNNGATWVKWSGKTSSSLKVKGSATNNGCLYRCVVKNSKGSVTSNAARLTVSGVKPSILTQPQSQTVNSGATVSFTVVAAGSGLSYQWQWSKDGRTWKNCASTGYNEATFSFMARSSMNGRQYRCIVKNEKGSITSSAAKLTVK